MDFQLPELGEGIYEAELIRWLVKPGQAVKRGQSLMEVMTDKATMEVPSPFAGTVSELRAEEGRQMKIGDVVLTYGGTGPGKEDAQGDGIGEKRGETVKQRGGDSEITNATPHSTRQSARTEVATGPPLVVPPLGGSPLKGELQTPRGEPLRVKAAPSVRLFARKLGIDLTQIRGSGPDGRILVEDLAPFSREPKASELSVPPTEPHLDFGTAGTRQKFQALRRKIAENMVRAKKIIPHSTYVDECDVSDLVKLRESLRETYAAAGIKLTYLAFFVKAVVAALKEIPVVNSSLDEDAGEIALHDHYHIGIAAATPGGLIVPVIHDADKKDLGQIAKEIDRLSSEARAGKARLEDLRGGSFTITSIGNVGGLISTPIINHPQVAILGVGKIVKRPVFDPLGNIRPADVVYLSLSFDHRVLDGAVAAAFTNAVIRHLQNPAVLLVSDKLT
jgi:pyruvate dehydrogenase E2 component (dihydrolipoamide acetyltransferase)/2-oxoisovalerate dehydrogenase E2 component (dihydrolipoyl transacylase)